MFLSISCKLCYANMKERWKKYYCIDNTTLYSIIVLCINVQEARAELNCFKCNIEILEFSHDLT